jgi:hypothetical protein
MVRPQSRARRINLSWPKKHQNNLSATKKIKTKINGFFALVLSQVDRVIGQ